MLKEVNIEILDYFKKNQPIKEIRWIDEGKIESTQKELSEKHPNCNVNFYWEKYNENYILGKVKNIEKDRLLVNEGEMEWEGFINKWFPSTIKNNKWNVENFH